MNIKELRDLIANLPDSAPVYIWADEECQDVVNAFTTDESQEVALHLSVE